MLCKVTQEAINRGSHKPCSCPVAEAIITALHERGVPERMTLGVSVVPDYIRIWGCSIAMTEFDERVGIFIRQYDRRTRLPSIVAFEFDLPDEFVERCLKQTNDDIVKCYKSGRGDVNYVQLRRVGVNV